MTRKACWIVALCGVLPGLAAAGLLDQMDDAARHVAYCRQAADDAVSEEKWDAAQGAWMACLSEAKRRGFDTVVPALEAQVDISTAIADNAFEKTTNPHAFAMAVLQVAAEHSAVDLPSDDVRRTFRSWMDSDEGRAYVEDVRTVTVIWSSDKDAARINETFQRKLEDCGLKWATSGSPDVDVILYASLVEKQVSKVETLASGEMSKAGPYSHADASVTIEKIRFKRRNANAKGFSASANADRAEGTAARDAALGDAMDLAAHVVLQRTLAELF